MEMKKEKNGFLFNLLLATIFWNIWLPKAGIKISGIPVTFGNILLAILLICDILGGIRKKKTPIKPIEILIIAGVLYFTIKYLMIFWTSNELISSIGYIIPLCIYPLIFFVAYDLIDTKEKMNKVVKTIVNGFWFLCIYALLQSIVGIENCAIPGITVNLSDYQQYGRFWYMTKANGTDINNIKIVGTYQNGNLFGISLILIYPLVYNYYKKIKKVKKQLISLIIFIITVFLTLSRACWLGIVLFVILGVIFDTNSKNKDISKKIVITLICIIGIICVLIYMPSVANRFLNTNMSDWISMSGRTEGLIEVMKSVNSSNSVLAYFIGPHGISEYSGLAYEMMPLSVFVQTGFIGLILLYSVFFNTCRICKNDNYISLSIRTSLIIWMIVGCIECGYWLPPAALNVFMLIAIGLKANELYKNEELE